jgi:alkylated DNA repair dioxygenase AlkB
MAALWRQGASRSNRMMSRSDRMSIAVTSDPSFLYVPDFVTQAEEQGLLAHVDREPWMTDLRRRVQHYGYRYDYRARVIDISMHLGPIPMWLLRIGERLVEGGYFPELPDQVIINEYEPGQGIRDHVDCEPCFGPTIVSVSLGSACVMNLTQKGTRRRTGCLLEQRSAVVLQNSARYDWMHGIAARRKDVWFGQTIERKRRVSLTFRQVILSDTLAQQTPI